MDAKLFTTQDEEPAESRVPATPWKVLVVDDDEDVLAVTRLVFASFRFDGRPIALFSATSGAGARALLQTHDDFAVAFIDVVMETDSAGLELVRYIRDELMDDELQVILRTGQPGYAPELQVILEYGINDYRTKTELDNIKLLSCLVSGLRNHQNIVRARQAVSREAVLAELNRAKSLFFAQMSHDLRTPLNSIQGFCQLLELSSLDEEQLDQVRMIRESGNHLLSLVNDILDLSKAEAGKIRLESIVFSLHELVLDTVAFLQPQVRDGVTFDTVMAPGVPNLVQGDPMRVRQILYNLLSNAFKFTRAGWVKLTVSTEDGATPRDPANCRLVISVTDTGKGIPREHLASLFSIYEQGDASVNRFHGGTGLGLHICKQLVELMGGRIEVSSTPGSGTTFRVALELKPVRDKLAVARMEALPLPVMRAYARILVVDDDAVNGLILRKLLERRGYDVTCAERGSAALELAQQARYDMVFMDCQMPGLSGEETTQRLRRLEGYAKVPIIALTGNRGEDSKAACFKAGMNDFMTKPIEKEALYVMVAKWLGLRTMMK